MTIKRVIYRGAGCVLVAAIVATIWVINQGNMTGMVDSDCSPATASSGPFTVSLLLLIKAGCLANQYAGLVAALATLVTAIFTGTLWWSTNRLWLASKDQIVAARDAIRVAEHVGHAQTRAYIMFSRMDIKTAIDAGNNQVFVFEPVFKNTGQSPGRVSRIIISTRVVEDGNVDGIDWENKLEERNDDIAFGNGEEAPLGELDIPLKDAVRMGENYRIFYRVKIEYRTFIDAGRRCHTAHVVEIKAVGNPSQCFTNGVAPSIVFKFVGHGRGSSMD